MEGQEPTNHQAKATRTLLAAGPGRIVCRPLAYAEKTKSGIYIPQAVREGNLEEGQLPEARRAIVLDVGPVPLCPGTGREYYMYNTPLPDSMIVVDGMAGISVEHDGEALLIIKTEEVQGMFVEVPLEEPKPEMSKPKPEGDPDCKLCKGDGYDPFSQQEGGVCECVKAKGSTEIPTEHDEA